MKIQMTEARRRRDELEWRQAGGVAGHEYSQIATLRTQRRNIALIVSNAVSGFKIEVKEVAR